MRHFAHNIGDYAAATAHLSFIEDAAYHRLLRRYYQDEKPLPAELASVIRLAGARTKEEREAVRVVLEEFFTLQADGWHQTRADREIAGYRERAEQARRNGAKSGGRPKPTDNPPGYAIGSDKEPEEEPNPNQTQKLTSNQYPVTSSEPNGSGAGAPACAITKSVFDEGVDLLARKGVDPRKARGIVGQWRKKAGDDERVRSLIRDAIDRDISDPIAWFSKALEPRPANDPWAGVII